MKLGELRTAIRNHPGKVYLATNINGVELLVPLSKTEFHRETLLDLAETRYDETGLIMIGDVVRVDPRHTSNEGAEDDFEFDLEPEGDEDEDIEFDLDDL